MLQRHDEAVEAARTSMSLDPHYWRAIAVYADVLSSAGRHEEAEQAAHRVVELAPDNSESHFMLGHVKEARRQWHPAFCAYAEALRLDPENLRYRRRMAELERTMGRPVQALVRFVEAARMDPGRPENFTSVFEVTKSMYRRAELLICVATFSILGGEAMIQDTADGERVGAAIVLGAGIIAVWRAVRALPTGTGSILWTVWSAAWFMLMAVPMCAVVYILVVVTGLDQLLWYVVPGIVTFEVLAFTMLYIIGRRRRAAEARAAA